MAGALSTSPTTPEQPVPEARRLGRGSLTMAWWGICSAMFYLVVAAALAMGYGTLNALIGLLLSVFSYGAINAVIARHAKTAPGGPGVSTCRRGGTRCACRGACSRHSARPTWFAWTSRRARASCCGPTSARASRRRPRPCAAPGATRGTTVPSG